MGSILCAPIRCDCGERTIWAADAIWIAKEGLDLRALPSLAYAQPPAGASDVTGKFTIRCRRCLEPLSVLPVLRARIAAGAATVFGEGMPAARGAGPGREPIAGGLARAMGRDARRARRRRAAFRAKASIALDLTIVDISIVGVCGEHRHGVQTGSEYTLFLSLPGEPEAVRVMARVMWTQPCRIDERRGVHQPIFRSGFAFLDPGAAALAAIGRYVVADLPRS